MKRKIQGNSKGKEKQDSSTKAKLSVEDEPKAIDHKRRIGRGEFKGISYKCGEVGHSFNECPKVGDRRGVFVNEVKVQDSQPKQGESLLAW